MTSPSPSEPPVTVKEMRSLVVGRPTDPAPRFIDYMDVLPTSAEGKRKAIAVMKTLAAGFKRMSAAARKAETDMTTLSVVFYKARGK